MEQKQLFSLGEFMNTALLCITGKGDVSEVDWNKAFLVPCFSPDVQGQYIGSKMITRGDPSRTITKVQ